MLKFKEGDIVKIIGDHWHDCIGIVESVKLNGEYYDKLYESEYLISVDYDEEERFSIQKESCLELYTDLMSREEFLSLQPEGYLEAAEYLTEMATVTIDRKHNFRIQVNPDRKRIGVPYFKVFNSSKLKSGETKVARFHFLDNKMEYYKDEYIDWYVRKTDLNKIRNLLMDYHEDFPNYTNWEMACYLWNMEYGFDIKRREYFLGKYDKEYKDNPSYVPSITSIPKTWKYDPPKNKNKRK